MEIGMTTRKKTYLFLILVTLFAAGAYLLVPYFSSASSVSSADSGKPPEDKEASVPVEIAMARRGEISSTIASTANLKAQREVDVASQAEGVVKEVLVEEGDVVSQGQLLCRLDDSQAQIRLQSARQKLAQARLQLEKARIQEEKAQVQVKNTRDEFDRYQKLYAERLVSEKEVAQVKYRLDELEHDQRASDSQARELTHRVEELEAEIAQSELEIAHTRVYAPFSGVITARTVNVGQTVRNLDPLFKLGDFTPLQADVFLSEREAATIRPGQSARILSNVGSDEGAQGTVARISPVVDQSTGTVKVTVELARGSQTLKPGAFVRVEIRTDTRAGTILVPKRALVEEDGERFLFVAENDTVKRVKVEAGYQNGSEIEILSGVSDGQAVVVAGQGALKDGSKIRLVERVTA
jgi:membrane fusion protein (multidrug efflux system)